MDVADERISRTKPPVEIPLSFTNIRPEVAALGTTTVRLVAVAVEAETSTVPVNVVNTTRLLLAFVLKFDPVKVKIALRVVRVVEIPLSTGPPACTGNGGGTRSGGCTTGVEIPGGVKVIPAVSDPAA